MKKAYMLLPGVLISFIIINGCNQSSEQNQDKPQMSQEEMVKHGEYLVTTIGCGDCHTPKKMGPMGPEPDPELHLSGHRADQPIGPIDKSILGDWALMNHDLTAAVGPWGVSFAANLTSDETGIGTWTLDQFKKAIREGKFKGKDDSRPLLPPMPWQNFAQLTDEDLTAIFVYLKSTKPISNVVPAAITPDQIK